MFIIYLFIIIIIIIIIIIHAMHSQGTCGATGAFPPSRRVRARSTGASWQPSGTAHYWYQRQTWERCINMNGTQFQLHKVSKDDVFDYKSFYKNPKNVL